MANDLSAAPRYSLWQAMGAAVELSLRAIEEVRALSRQPGPEGPRGQDGRLGIVRAWREGVHYEGDLVTHGGSTFQARRDTGKEPPHDDWACIAAGGRDGSAPRFRGTFSGSDKYRHLDVVAYNGSSFGALKDDPGPCPGDGWQLLASAGKRGKDGLPGARGEPGMAGPPGASVVGGAFDAKEMRLVFALSDGGVVAIDLYDLALAI